MGWTGTISRSTSPELGEWVGIPADEFDKLLAVYDAAMGWFQHIEIQRGDAYEHNLLAELEQACRRAKEGK